MTHFNGRIEQGFCFRGFYFCSIGISYLSLVDEFILYFDFLYWSYGITYYKRRKV